MKAIAWALIVVATSIPSNREADEREQINRFFNGCLGLFALVMTFVDIYQGM